MATIDENGFLLILSLRYAIFICYLLAGLLWLRKNRKYALNQFMFLTSLSFSLVNLSYAMIDTLAYLIQPFPLTEMNVFRDIYGVFLGLIFVFFYISSEIIEYSWETVYKQKRKALIWLLIGYGIFLVMFLPNDEVLPDGTIQFKDIGNIAWLVIVILFVLIYRKLFKVMRTVQEKRKQAQVFIIAISMLLVGFLYFIIVNMAVENPPYVMLHGDNFLYITVGIIFVIINLRKSKRSK